MEGLDLVKSLLRRSDYMVTIDLSQAFYHIPLAEFQRKYFAIVGADLWSPGPKPQYTSQLRLELDQIFYPVSLPAPLRCVFNNTIDKYHIPWYDLLYIPFVLTSYQSSYQKTYQIIIKISEIKAKSYTTLVWSNGTKAIPKKYYPTPDTIYIYTYI
ncbi:hypothetical protein RclHR1_01060025 [Rhizophagus clarus]|uniref:Reverse transcriptase domain-containing protein n=1 Tax=Rhizophagus clarus TaxID=94130 RepID=A0A2Z6QGM5_9GLOM|nr:hypothetical protein RclHR1_01060025 [Rhizophagus clarus]GES79361.1 hypothetical protein GLOIN_2v1521207 [Rhizophagus clarus]